MYRMLKNIRRKSTRVKPSRKNVRKGGNATKKNKSRRNKTRKVRKVRKERKTRK